MSLSTTITWSDILENTYLLSICIFKNVFELTYTCCILIEILFPDIITTQFLTDFEEKHRLIYDRKTICFYILFGSQVIKGQIYIMFKLFMAI